MSANKNWFIFPVWENDQKETKIRLFDLCTSHSICFKEGKKKMNAMYPLLPSTALICPERRCMRYISEAEFFTNSLTN